jgi:hypothetical protein
MPPARVSKRHAASLSRTTFAIVLICLTPRDAFAYVDPGSGLLLIQGLLALVGGIIVFVTDPVGACKRLWARCVARFRQRDQ